MKHEFGRLTEQEYIDWLLSWEGRAVRLVSYILLFGAPVWFLALKAWN